ncbi:MAG: hypothetical protein M3R27_15395 [Bacteroidota bacterium]|nr:hypothetical protein [Bacteroidota bacterium]
MKNILLSLIITLTSILSVNAQSFEWAKAIGMIGNPDVGTAAVSDKDGNVYMTGYFTGTTSFGDTILSSVRGSNSFIAKYSSAGNLLWVRQSKGYSLADGLRIDSTGVYAVGAYGGYFASSDPFFPEYSDPSKFCVDFGCKSIFIAFSREVKSEKGGVNF